MTCENQGLKTEMLSFIGSVHGNSRNGFHLMCVFDLVMLT